MGQLGFTHTPPVHSSLHVHVLSRGSQAQSRGMQTASIGGSQDSPSEQSAFEPQPLGSGVVQIPSSMQRPPPQSSVQAQLPSTHSHCEGEQTPLVTTQV